MVTILQVAQEAGVSVATVSRVINKSGKVKEKTIQKVTDAIEKLGYAPNLQARNLRRNESGAILVLLPNITNYYYAHIFEGINEEARKQGYHVFLSSTQGRNQEEMLRDAIRQKQADGAILLALNREDSWISAYSREFPVVQCCEYAENGSTAHISIDNYAAGYEATKYLIQLGHKRIGMLSSRNHFLSTQKREQGYLDALRDGGMELDADWIAYVDESYSYSSSLTAVRQLLSLKERPDALFCIGDEPAFGAVVVADEMGIRVPEELSVVGFDDVNYTTMIHPYLTTMAQPCGQLGQRAVKMLLSLIRGGKLEPADIVLPYKFIERESTCRRL